jgi:hypothetical protein
VYKVNGGATVHDSGRARYRHVSVGSWRPPGRLVGRNSKLETVPQRVARATFQLDETGINGTQSHAQTGRIRHTERGHTRSKSARAPVGTAG